MQRIKRFFVAIGIVAFSLLAILLNLVLMRFVQFDFWPKTMPAMERPSASVEPPMMFERPESRMLQPTSRELVVKASPCINRSVRANVDSSLQARYLEVQIVIQPDNARNPNSAAVAVSSGDSRFDEIVLAAAGHCIAELDHEVANMKPINVRYSLP